MITTRPSAARGHFDHGWLDTRHTFSFGRYQDPKHMGFRSLRVINEDRVAPGQGFGEHPHADMEILSYVLSGSLAHRDSLGNTFTVTPGQVQRMSAGTGVEHSEFNPSKAEPVHFLQVWIRPDAAGAKAAYDQKEFPIHAEHNTLHLLASKSGRDGSLAINQNAGIYAGVIDAGQTVAHPLAPGRHAWVQVARGEVTLNGTPLAAGDGAAISDEPSASLVATREAEVLVFDLA
ncbi:MAG: pirin family protein [Phycisphaerales bacterium]|nr:pirin family protein [Phycisphaerales bacterium]